MLSKIIIGVVLVVIGIFAFGFFTKGEPEFPPSNSPTESSESKQSPDCPESIALQTPVDINKVTSILYPGQERSGDFKPHGGFRFDSSKNDEIEVRAPIDAVLAYASRYIVQGEIQYTLDFQTPCGIMYRFGHLLTLAPKFAAIAVKLPEPKENDSRTTSIEEGVKVTQGEIIATAVGFRNTKNVFVDFGVYDLTKSGAYQNLKKFAICWFDLLSSEDGAKVKSLPSADSVSGTKSAYCKP